MPALLIDLTDFAPEIRQTASDLELLAITIARGECEAGPVVEELKAARHKLAEVGVEVGRRVDRGW